MAGSVFLQDGENKRDKDGRRTVWVTGLMKRTSGPQALVQTQRRCNSYWCGGEVLLSPNMKLTTQWPVVWRSRVRFWRSCDRPSLIYSFKYNQQDATLYNILYYCQCSTYFRRFRRPSSACWLLPLTVAASKLGIYQMLCVQFLNSWWRAEKPPETCTAVTIIKNIA
jgi:hypothetical protein